MIEITDSASTVVQTSRAMKFRIFSFLVVLFVMLWAHSAIQSAAAGGPDQTQAQQAKSECPCCGKDGAGTDGGMTSCCHDMAADRKDAKSCGAGKDRGCCGKDEMACKRTDKSGEGMAHCADGCKATGNDCCKGKGDKGAMKCCGDHCASHAGVSGRTQGAEAQFNSQKT